jgi:hypothetical protein
MFASAPASNVAWFTSASIVATCALLFTILSFWWLNARRGDLKTFEPHTFAAAMHGQVRIRIPIVFYNTGPTPIVVQNLRLRLSGSDPLPWITTRAQLKPTSDDNHQFAAVFAVGGRSTQQLFVEFGFSGTLDCKDYEAKIEAKLGHKKSWKPLLSFTLRASNAEHPTSYITYSNDPDPARKRIKPTTE